MKQYSFDFSAAQVSPDVYISRTFVGGSRSQTFDEWLNDAHRKGWQLVSHAFNAFQQKHCVFINMRKT